MHTAIALLVVAVVCLLWHMRRRPWADVDPWDLQAFVISVPGTRCRQAVQQRFAGKQPFQFADGVNGVDMSPHPTLAPGQLGCALSHVLLWRRLADSELPVMIFEDDAVLCEGWRDRVRHVLQSLDDSIDIVYLGSCADDGSGTCYARGLRNSERPRCTHGYMLTPSGLRKLAAWAETAVLMLPIEKNMPLPS